MGLIDLASGNSLWRGYDYYKKNRVDKYNKLSEYEYECIITGSNNKKYNVLLTPNILENQNVIVLMQKIKGLFVNIW